MKKHISLVLAILLLLSLIGCGSESSPSVAPLSQDAEKLVAAPSINYVFECLKHVPSITGIEIATENESKDFTGMSNCNGTIYFTSNLIDQDRISGDNVQEKGTAGGGSIDIFSTSSEAQNRNDYLSSFDGTLLDSGAHVVVGSIVIRISSKLSKNEQEYLQNCIVDVLTSGDITEPNTSESTWCTDEPIPAILPTIATTTPSTTEPIETQPPTEDITIPPETTNHTQTWDGIELTISDLSVNTESDYAHVDTDVILLGNNEGVSITITIEKGHVTLDDLIVYYEDDLLNVKVSTPAASDHRTVFELYVTGRTACKTELLICTAYDLATLGEDNTSCFILDILKLDSTEGRIAYVTYSGDKYHFSAACAGDSAIKTTFHDVAAYEYDPCGKCAK